MKKMIDRVLEKADFIAGLLPFAALFGLAFFVANIEIKDLDIWLHLGLGKYIAHTGNIPTTDILSFSFNGNPWVNHEWLFQLILYKVYEFFGPAGLQGLQAGVVMATLFCLFVVGYSRKNQIVMAIFMILAFLIYQQRFTIRPDIFSLFFFAFYIMLLSIFIDRRWTVPVVFIIQVLWSNMHGFFFFGPLFIFLGMLSEIVKRRIPLPWEWNDVGRLTDDELSRLTQMFIVSVLACLVNPQFIHGAMYPIRVFFSLSGDSEIFFQHIQELAKPFAPVALTGGKRYIFYKLMIVLSGVTFIFNRRRIDVSALLLWTVFLVFSLKAVRNNSYFAFSAFLCAANNFSYISLQDIIPLRFTQTRFIHITQIFLKGLLLIWILNYAQLSIHRAYYDIDRYEVKSEFGGVDLDSVPRSGADFLIRNNLKGNFFNNFNSGAYLVGRVFPQIKVYIDGRTEVYGGEFFKRYLDIFKEGSGKLFEEEDQRLNFDGVFLSVLSHSVSPQLLKYLYHKPEWHLVYFGYDAVIFLKETPANQKVIDQYDIDLSAWHPSELDLYRLGVEFYKPFANYFRAYTLESMDFDQPAMEEAQYALKVFPTYSGVYRLIGKVLTKSHRFSEASDMFRKASMLDPFEVENRLNFALALFESKKYYEATKEYENILQHWPDNDKARFFLVKCRILQGDGSKVLPEIRTFLNEYPDVLADILDLALTFHLVGDQQSVQIILDWINNRFKDNPESFLQVGIFEKKRGDVVRALALWQKGLDLTEKDSQLYADFVKEIDALNGE